MVLDSSAIIAIELQEPGFERLIEKIGDAKAVVIGVPTMFENHDGAVQAPRQAPEKGGDPANRGNSQPFYDATPIHQ